MGAISQPRPTLAKAPEGAALGSGAAVPAASIERLLCEADAWVGRGPWHKVLRSTGEPAGGSGTTAESDKKWTFTFYGVKNKTDTITSTDGSFGPVEGALHASVRRSDHQAAHCARPV
jgi:hypothetical protein